MSQDILGNFINHANKDRGTTSNNFGVDMTAIPTPQEPVRAMMNKSSEDFSSVGVEDQAVNQELCERGLLNNTGFIPTDVGTGEVEAVELDFKALDFRVPYECQTYDELATVTVGNIFLAEGISSMNCDFFGSFLEHSAPRHCSKITIGSHEFIIREDSDERLVYIVEFLQRAKSDLDTYRRFECSLVTSIEVNHSTAYTLVLTPKDLRDIKKSFSHYKISFLPTKNIADLKLIIEL